MHGVRWCSKIDAYTNSLPDSLHEGNGHCGKGWRLRKHKFSPVFTKEMSIVERGRDCSTGSFPCVLNVNFYLKKLVTANREEEAILTVKELFHLLV